MVFFPITHDLVGSATVHTPGLVAHLVHEVTRESGTGWPQFQVVDVAIQGLRQTIDELCHATKPPPQVLQSSISRRSTEIEMDAIRTSHCRVTNNQESASWPVAAVAEWVS